LRIEYKKKHFSKCENGEGPFTLKEAFYFIFLFLLTLLSSNQSMTFSLGEAVVAHSRNASVGRRYLVIELFVTEARVGRANAFVLAHLEVFTEVLVTAPPVSVDHVKALVTECLMEVRVADVVLNAISGEAAAGTLGGVSGVGLSNTVSEVLNHFFLLVLNHNVEEERRVKMIDNKDPQETNTVLAVERIDLPVSVGNWVLEEPRNVFKCAPLLSLITGLVSVGNKFVEVTISFTS